MAWLTTIPRMLAGLLLAGALALPAHAQLVAPPPHPAREKPTHPAHARPRHRPTAPAKPAPVPPAAPVAATPAPSETAPTTTQDAAAPPGKMVDPNKGPVTGLKLPRFASLKYEVVYMRDGAGKKFALDWEYHRRELPVRIEREVDAWRLVEDPDGVKGWIQTNNLDGRRTIIVTGAQRDLRRNPDAQAGIVAQLLPGVIGRLLRCDAGSAWCQVQVQTYRGWLQRTEFWGTDPDEVVQ